MGTPTNGVAGNIDTLVISIVDNDAEPAATINGLGYAPGGRSSARPRPSNPEQGFVVVPASTSSDKELGDIDEDLQEDEELEDLKSKAPPPSPKTYLTDLRTIYATDRIVTLRFNASDNVDRMAISNSPGFVLIDPPIAKLPCS